MKKLLLALLLTSTAFARGRIQNEDMKSLTDIQSGAQTTTGTLSSVTNCISAVGTTTNIAVGQFVYDVTTPANILVGTTVAGLPGSCASGQIKMSANAAGNGSGDTISFGGQMSQLTNDTKVFITANGLNEQLSTAIANNAFAGSSSNASSLVANAGLSVTLGGASSLVLSVKTSSGGAPTVGNPVVPYFRNVTANNGQFNPVNITAALTLTLPQNATLGVPLAATANTQGPTSDFFVYLLNDGGTVDLCAASGVAFNDTSVTSTNPTLVSATARSRGVLYCASTHSSGPYPIRLLGRVNSSLYTATVTDSWLGPINEVALSATAPLSQPIITTWTQYTPTFTCGGCSTSSPISTFFWRRVGNMLELRGTYFHSTAVGWTAGSGVYRWSLPAGLITDTTQSFGQTIPLTGACGPGAVQAGATTAQGEGETIMWDTSNFAVFAQSNVGFANGHGFASSVFYNLDGNTVMTFWFSCKVPIQGWY